MVAPDHESPRMPASRPRPALPRHIVVFDLGGVLIDWDPRYLYRRVFGADEAAMEHFLATVCTSEWNHRQDAGRPLAEATRLLKAEHPAEAALIELWAERWPEMIAGDIAETVAILEELDARGTPLYALTNWSAETFPHARERFPFLARFRGILVSGEVGVIKPDPRIYHLLFERFAIAPERTVFIDDNAANITAAAALGLHAHRFTGPAPLRAELGALGLLEG